MEQALTDWYADQAVPLQNSNPSDEVYLGRPQELMPSLIVTSDADFVEDGQNNDGGQADVVELSEDSEPEPGEMKAEPHMASPELDKIPLNDSERLYFNQVVKRQKLLTAKEEVELAKSIEAGVLAQEVLDRAVAEETILSPQYRADLQSVASIGQEAHNRFVSANLRLVASIANKLYRSTGHNFQLLDVMQEGTLGLMRAIEKFDYTKGFKFSTYATWWIRQSISRAINDTGTMIYIPVNYTLELNRIEKAHSKWQAQWGEAPTTEQLAKEMDMPAERVQQGLAYIALRGVPVSLDAPIGHDADRDASATLGDMVADESPGNAAAMMERVEYDAAGKRLVELLQDVLGDERKVKIIMLRAGLHGGPPLTLAEIGGQLGITRERVRQLEGRARELLKEADVPARLGLASEK